RHNLLRYCALWLLLPFALFVASAWWYRAALPTGLDELIFHRMPAARRYFEAFLSFSPLLLLGGLVMAVRQPARVSRFLAGVMLLVGLLNLGAFEFLRESGRKPYVIPGYMYANALRPDQLLDTTSRGMLQSARWSANREINAANRTVAGREVYNLLCLSCHAVGGPLNDIRVRIAGLTREEKEQIIFEMGSTRPYMPPFAGNQRERQALLSYLDSLL
ncbi:MAG TPA: cytochrome c, partial [Desulfurivibrionaceae bacterium]|nr:cytochrome c [Desulfurivibrionaceae bacterium]